MAELRMTGISVAYADSEPILRDISFAVQTGETVVILGMNGCGKTTLLKVAAGLLAPSGGDAVIHDTVPIALHGNVGLVLQNPDHQMIASSVEEEIALGLEMRTFPREQMIPIVERTLRRFDLLDLRFRSPEALSGGQKQRVALAAIMVTNPRFLLLDEPDSFLDAPSRRELFEYVDQIRQECGIIWVTPHPRRAPKADRFFLLDAGQITPMSENEIRALSDDSLIMQ